jgi:hypothetical protein
MPKFLSSSAIFNYIENNDLNKLNAEISKNTPNQLLLCLSDLIRTEKSVRSYNLLEASCLSENAEALGLLLSATSIWGMTRLKGALNIAVKSKNFSLTEVLLTHGISASDAFLAACQAGNSELVNHLLLNNYNEINLSNSTHITAVAANGNLPLLIKLEEYGFNLHAKDDEALCLAIRGKHIKCAKYLISKGANVNAQNGQPLKLAIINKDLPMVNELLDSGSEVIKVSEEEYITLAERYGQLDIANLLRTKLAQLRILPKLNTSQSTHASSVDLSAAQSALRLSERYKNILCPSLIDQVTQELMLWSNDLEKSSVDKKMTAHRALDDILRGRPEVHANTGISLKELLILSWIAIHDETLRIGDLSESLKMLEEGLYEIQRGYNDLTDTVSKDVNICQDGKFNKIMEKLVGIHPDVAIDFITKEVASFKLLAVVRDEAKKYIGSSSPLLEHSMFRPSPDVESIWNFIRENVKSRIFSEFSSLFNSYDDKDFNSFIDTGIYVDLDSEASELSEDASDAPPGLSQNVRDS